MHILREDDSVYHTCVNSVKYHPHFEKTSCGFVSMEVMTLATLTHVKSPTSLGDGVIWSPYMKLGTGAISINTN